MPLFETLAKKSTPSEHAILIVLVVLACIISGIIFLVMGFREPPEKHEIALALEWRGAWCLGIGMAISAGFWLFRRLVD